MWSRVWEQRHAAVFAALMTAAIAAAQFLPGCLGQPAGLVQERAMLALLPALLAFVWWIR